MDQYIPDILLWLFVINHGIAFGAGLYEQRIILPQWFTRSTESGLRVNTAAMRSTVLGADSGRLSQQAHSACLLWRISSSLAISRSKARLVAWCCGNYAGWANRNLINLNTAKVLALTIPQALRGGPTR